MNPWSTLGIDVVILMLLAADGQHFTGSIRDSINEQGGRVNDPTISIALKRFEERGVVYSLGKQKGNPGRPRNYFALTPQGEQLVHGMCRIIQPALESTLEKERKVAS